MSAPDPAAFFAHTRPGVDDQTQWEPLLAHLQRVAQLAEQFATRFDAAAWGRLAGLWHDLGKYHPRFQQRLSDESVRQPHAGAGAALARECDARRSLPLQFAVAGHHAGLANLKAADTDLPRPLEDRLADALKEELKGARPNVPSQLLEEKVPPLPGWITGEGGPAPAKEEIGLRLEMWTRFLFSALVDADRLATEAFCSPAAARRRERRPRATMAELAARLEAHLSGLEGGLTEEARARPINMARAAISAACRRAADDAPGFFSLTVPTGGGKTLAAMRFALHHAARLGLERVVVVIPYTSIIEQNAARYAEVFGAEQVLEHHSNLDVEKKRAERGEDVLARHEMAAENWDAPIVVTTNVQFFETLFTNRPSRARKLHRVARSVIVLDEVQALPTEFLLAILDGLRQLVGHYGCSVVLSTATPPALRQRDNLPDGVTGVREIVEDPGALAAALRRVEYAWPDLEAPATTWEELADEAAREHQALVVVHRRADARELAQALDALVGAETVFHLSALMCPRHRLEVLEKVRRALKEGEPCRLVSTQLIEAGVDVDFPVVFRAMAGLDSIVQAAGRCNREARLGGRGRVVVFRAPTQPPSGILRRGMECAATMLREGALDADDPEVQERYFRAIYFGSKLDPKEIQPARRTLNFATVGREVRLIDDSFTRTIAIPWQQEGAEAVAALRAAMASGFPVGRDLFRAVQPLSVSVFAKAFEQARRGGAIEDLGALAARAAGGSKGAGKGGAAAESDGPYALAVTHAHHYDPRFGLVIGDDIAVAEPGALML